MEENKIYNILFCGVGGQGVLKASEVCGNAAVLEGFHVKKSEVHGMSQRGGSVESHLRFGRDILSPLIAYGEADFLVSFYEDEHDRMVGYLKETGKDLVKYLEKAQEKLTDKRLLNTYLLGVLSRDLPISEENWLKSIETTFTRMLDENKRIFIKGRNEK